MSVAVIKVLEKLHAEFFLGGGGVVDNNRKIAWV